MGYGQAGFGGGIQTLIARASQPKTPVAVVPRKPGTGGALPPPVVTPIIPPPPTMLPGGGGSGGPVVVVPGTPGPQPEAGTVAYAPSPATGGAPGGAAGGGSGTPATAAVADGMANLMTAVKANPVIAVAAVLVAFYALRKGRGTRRW